MIFDFLRKRLLGRAQNQFGPFLPLFIPENLEEGDPGPVVLLHLSKPYPFDYLGRIEKAIRAGDTETYAPRVLEHHNWRLHLVGAVTALLWEGGTLLVPAMWKAIDAGSWVTPQLVAALVLLDTDFAAHATARVEAGCPVVIPKRLNSLTRHTATGPHGPYLRSAKMAASILALCENTALEAWAAEISRKPEIGQLVADDVDSSGDIATNWLTAMEDMLVEYSRLKQVWPGLNER